MKMKDNKNSIEYNNVKQRVVASVIALLLVIFLIVGLSSCTFNLKEEEATIEQLMTKEDTIDLQDLGINAENEEYTKWEYVTPEHGAERFKCIYGQDGVPNIPKDNSTLFIKNLAFFVIVDTECNPPQKYLVVTEQSNGHISVTKIDY